MKGALHLSLILCLLVFACKKNHDPVLADTNSDYRDRFTGSYTGHKLCTYWTISNPVTDTTFNGTVTFQVIKHPTDPGKIIVENDTIAMDSSGSYTGFYDPQPYKNYSLYFTNDSLYRSTFSGGLGGGTSCSTKGKRQ